MASASPPTPAPLVSGVLIAMVGAVLSMRTLRVASEAALPAASDTRAVMVLLLASAGMSALAKSTCHLPSLPTEAVLVLLPQSTETVRPASASLVPLTVTPAVFLARLTISLLATVLIAITGTAVSRTKLLVPARLALPAASVATALTLTLPSPRRAISAASNTTATDEPPLTVLITVLLLMLLLKVTTTLAPLSALTVTTPPGLASASALVAPPVTPLPSATTGAVGARVSMTGSAGESMVGMVPPLIV